MNTPHCYLLPFNTAIADMHFQCKQLSMLVTLSDTTMEDALAKHLILSEYGVVATY